MKSGENMKISNNIDDNIREFKRVYSDCSDIKMQEMYVGKNGKLKCFLAYIEVTLPVVSLRTVHFQAFRFSHDD